MDERKRELIYYQYYATLPVAGRRDMNITGKLLAI